MKPWLSQQEIDDMCDPLTQFAAQARYIEREFKITPGRKPNGAPFVLRSEIEAARIPVGKKAKPAKCEPNRAGLHLAFSKKAG